MTMMIITIIAIKTIPMIQIVILMIQFVISMIQLIILMIQVYKQRQRSGWWSRTPRRHGSVFPDPSYPLCAAT